MIGVTTFLVILNDSDKFDLMKFCIIHWNNLLEEQVIEIYNIRHRHISLIFLF